MKKVTKRILTGTMCTVMATTTLAGCSSGSDNSGQSNGDNEQVTIDVALLSDDQNAVKAALPGFEEVYPNIKVNLVEIPSADYNDKVTVTLSAGDDYDVVMSGAFDFYTNLISKNVILPLDDYIEKDGIDTSKYGTTFENIEYDGSVYEMPTRNSEWVLYYNKELFDAAGVPYPEDSMTYDEFKELAKQMTSGEGTDKVYGAYLHSWPLSWYRIAIQDGASLLDQDLTPFKDAIQFRLDMEADGSIMPYTEQVATSANYRTEFLKGTVAMVPMGDFLIGQLRQAEENGELTFDWDIASSPIPEGAEPNTTTGMTAGMSIAKNSDNPDEAWEFIKYMSGLEGAKAYAESGYIPAYTDDAINEIIAFDGTTKPANSAILLDQKIYPEYPAVDRITEVTTIFGEESSLVLAGEASPDDMVTNIQKRIEELGL